MLPESLKERYNQALVLDFGRNRDYEQKLESLRNRMIYFQIYPGVGKCLSDGGNKKNGCDGWPETLLYELSYDFLHDSEKRGTKSALETGGVGLVPVVSVLRNTHLVLPCYIGASTAFTSTSEAASSFLQLPAMSTS